MISSSATGALREWALLAIQAFDVLAPVMPGNITVDECATGPTLLLVLSLANNRDEEDPGCGLLHRVDKD